MSLFPRFPTSELAPLLRIFDDALSGNGHPTGGHPHPHHARGSAIRAFQPRFDVRELKGSYELQGELPGIDQADVQIEFTDPHTLVVKGRTEREYSSGTPPTAGNDEEVAAAEENNTTEQRAASPSHQTTVEDEEPVVVDSSDADASEVEAPTPASSTTETGDAAAVQKPAAAAAPPANKARYWVSERSVGDFHRSFTFAGRVDQEAVKASLKNGILSVVVPKAPEPTARRIQIQ